MKKIILATCAIGVALLTTACQPPAPKKIATKPQVRLTLLPQEALKPGKATTVLAKLNWLDNAHLIDDNQLAIAHTQKLHLLIIDPSLTDYQHIHPQPTATPGIYSFSFTPKLAGSYRAWADITPLATGQQEYVMGDLDARKAAAIDKTAKSDVSINGYRFTLSFDKPPTEDGESMGTIHITAFNGDPVTSLAPVMGAYAHIVGFYDDYRTVVHIHPMGPEPKNANGGPDLMFHLAPQRAGFVKLFAQVNIGGKEIFAPFAIMVKPAADKK